MNRRDTVTAGFAMVTVAATLNTAYLGTEWIEFLTSRLGLTLGSFSAKWFGVERTLLPNMRVVLPSGIGTQELAPPKPTVQMPVPTPQAILAAIAADPETAIGAITLHEELARMPLAEMLTTDERNDLQWMRAEENLARDVSLAFLLKWKKGPFASIAASEATHGDAVRQLLVRYHIADPAPGAEGTSATDPTFGRLYREFVTSGSKSYVDALRIGANIEEMDIRDLRERQSKREDIATVYDKLEAGARIHLRTFVKEIERQGVAWMPSYLMTPEFASIMGR